MNYAIHKKSKLSLCAERKIREKHTMNKPPLYSGQNWSFIVKPVEHSSIENLCFEKPTSATLRRKNMKDAQHLKYKSTSYRNLFPWRPTNSLNFYRQIRQGFDRALCLWKVAQVSSAAHERRKMWSTVFVVDIHQAVDANVADQTTLTRRRWQLTDLISNPQIIKF